MKAPSLGGRKDEKIVLNSRLDIANSMSGWGYLGTLGFGVYKVHVLCKP